MPNRDILKEGIFMYKRLCDYIDYIEEATRPENLKKLSSEQKKDLTAKLLTQIGFFQHERIIHLIVTHLFAMITIVTLVGMMYFKTIPMLILFVLEMSLVFPYIVHYYHLENGTQYLYTMFDRLNGEHYGEELQKPHEKKKK